MKTLRRLSYAALAVAYTHLVFGAIVRISGSGLGCGENWPKCYGHWFPPMNRPDLVIEWTHRLLASILITTVTLLAAMAWRKRHEPGVSGRGGVLRPAIGAFATVLGAAVLGAVTVFLGNAPYATAAHWTVAMTLVAVLVVTGVRAGGFGGGRGTRDAGGVLAETASLATGRTARYATIAAALAFLTVVMGGLTAKVPGGSVACRDFPLCGANPAVDAQAIAIQGTHRVLAFTVFFYLLAMVFALRQKGNARRVVIAGRVAFGLATLQILVAGAMIGMQLPAVLRSLHEAVGVAVWVTTFLFAYLARGGRRGAGGVELAPDSRADRDQIRMATPAGASAGAVADVEAEADTSSAVSDAIEPWMSPAVELIPGPIVEPVTEVVIDEAREAQAEAETEAAAEAPAETSPEISSMELAPESVNAEDPDRVPRPPSPVPTMAVIVARGADIL